MFYLFNNTQYRAVSYKMVKGRFDLRRRVTSQKPQLIPALVGMLVGHHILYHTIRLMIIEYYPRLTSLCSEFLCRYTMPKVLYVGTTDC